MILAALVLSLEAPSRPEPAQVQGWFYRSLREVDPALHDHPAPPPFALAVGGREGGYWLRVTLLSEALYAGFSPRLYLLAGDRLRFGTLEARVRAVLHDGHPWAGLTTYPRLFQGQVENDYPLRFVSPTFFKRKGNHYPLPEPKLVFRSLYERFKAYAPIKPPEEFPELFGRITLRKANLRTRPVEHDTRGVGIVGEAVYHLPNASEDEARWLTALWRFAFFAGVGAKTTLGFGQVKPYLSRPKPRVAKEDANGSGGEQDS